MKTRAILQTSPFKTRDGTLKAYVIMPIPGGYWTGSLDLRPEHEGLTERDTITVERHGSEWRAV